MHRREFLYTGVAGMLGATTARPAVLQGPPPSPGRKLKIDINSRHLQWLRSADEVAEAVAEMSFDGVDLNVARYPGHVDPAKVAQDLPAFVDALRKRELQVISITTAIIDTDSPNAEAILKAASSAGISHYSCGTFAYDKSKPILPQLDALRPRLAKLAALNARYKLTALVDTNSAGESVGSALWDWMFVLKDIDPAQIGIQYDVFHQTQNNGWEFDLKATGKYIGGISVRDFAFEQDLGLKGEGGAFVPPPPGSQPEGRGGRGGRGAPGGGGPPAGARGGGPRGGSRDTANASVVSGLVNGWKLKQVPLGTGMVNLPQLGIVLKEIGFAGPLEIKVEYANGGAHDAQDKVTLPRAQVLGTMKRDLLALRAAFTRSGLL